MTDTKIGMASIPVDDETKEAAWRALQSGKFVKGPETTAFESEFAAHHGSAHGVAVSNGTTALHLAYHALGIGRGDEVIVPSHTYLASITPAMHLGATPVFVEVDDATMTVDVDAVRASLTPKTKAITAVHLYGHPADMDPLQELADEHGIPLIADAAQAHDAAYNGRPIGEFGTVQTFSFYPSKNMTVCGDGGMILTHDDELADRLSMLRDHGRTPEKKYENDLLGFNFRMSDILAAVGRVQLKHLTKWTDRRREVAGRYATELSDVDGLRVPTETPGSRHAYHQYVVRCDDRDGLADHLKKDGISSGLHYPVPTHRQPCVTALHSPPSMPATERLVQQILSLPVHQGLSNDDVSRVIQSIRSFFGGA